MGKVVNSSENSIFIGVNNSNYMEDSHMRNSNNKGSTPSNNNASHGSGKNSIKVSNTLQTKQHSTNVQSLQIKNKTTNIGTKQPMEYFNGI
jgi:hypothetical protein